MSHPRKKNREVKKIKSFGNSSSKSGLDVKDKSNIKKWFSNQVPSNLSKNRNDRGSNPKPQQGRNVDTQKERPTFGKYLGECLDGTNSCYGCRKGDHMVKDFPNVRSKSKGDIKNPPSVPDSKAPKRNLSMHSRLGENKKALPTL